MLNPFKIHSAEINNRVTIRQFVKVTNERGVNLHPFRNTIRYRDGLSFKDRIVYQGRIFEQILPAKDINEQHQWKNALNIIIFSKSTVL